MLFARCINQIYLLNEAGFFMKIQDPGSLNSNRILELKFHL